MPSPPLNHVPKHHIYTSFKYLQGWWLNHFPGQPVPMLDNPFSEEFFPNIQSKPPWCNLRPFPLVLSLVTWEKRPDPHLPTTSFQVVVESNQVSPEPPPLQAKQSQFPQPAGSCSAGCQPAPPGPFPPGSFPAALPQACSYVGCCDHMWSVIWGCWDHTLFSAGPGM